MIQEPKTGGIRTITVLAGATGRRTGSRCRGHFLFQTLFLVLVLLSVTGGCRFSGDKARLTIGLPEEPRTLNIWLAGDANSWKVLGQIYQSMYRRDPDTLALIPWLAREMPVLEKDTLSYLVRLRTAKWSDGSDFTAHDVAFTARVFLDFKVPRYYSKWKAVRKIEVVDDHTVRFYLKKPSAIILSRVFTAPMVSKKQWEPLVKAALETEKPLRTLQNTVLETPMGTGPFVLAEYRKGMYIHMTRNPHFFGTGMRIGDRTLGPYIDGLMFRMYGTSDVAILALKKGEIDMYWWGIQPGYVADLDQTDHVAVHHNTKSAMYFMGFNLRKPPFDDVRLRRAVALLIDKPFIINRLLQNYGRAMPSVVPAGNRFWHNPGVTRYGDDLNREDRIRKAFELLSDAGYSWEVPPVDESGQVVSAQNMRLPGGKPMERWVILTPPADYDPKRAFAGMMIQEWLRDLGMPVFARPMSFGALLDTVKGRHEFDAFVLGYGRLNLDPDYVRTFFYSKNDKTRGWNMSGYHNPAFDALADAQRGEMDRENRRDLLFKMQEILLADVPYIPLYNPDILEAACTRRFTGWVDTVDGIGNIWSLCMVKPVTAMEQ